MTAPTCSTHHAPMKRMNNDKGWFCTRKSGDAWCSEKMYDKSTPSAPSHASPSVLAASTSPKHLLVVAALEAASRVYQGSSDAQGMIDCANSILGAAYFEKWAND